MKKLMIIALLSTNVFAGGGPDEGKQNKLGDVPEGYKMVKKDAECKDPDPCAKEKSEIDKLKKELERLKAENKILKEDIEELAECPEPEVKTVFKTKEVKVPVDKIVEKTVTKEVAVEVRSISIGGMVAYSQDGIETHDTDQVDKEDAYTYRSVIGGPYITIPIGERFEIGLFGMFGGINQTFGGKLGFNLK